ncbi:unnamed protein product [Schistosoma mattheei]|uniref:Uncharacterized protein n=1 Tax=Schistosoma mattheei TaxID=31246 RepID=A0A183Q516_9TREM|nr:unnamed protein product [Schistosoma mattheei]
MSSSEAKKLRNKQRKAAKRAEAEAARARAEQERREQAARSRQPASEEANADNPSMGENDLDANLLARVSICQLFCIKWDLHFSDNTQP